MRSNLFAFAAAGVIVVAAPALANDLIVRDWLVSQGFSALSGTSLWQGRIGSASGSLMTASSTSWTNPSGSFSTPLFGPLTTIGSDNGAAGPATFDGVWAHPGSGVDAVLVFAPLSPTQVGQVIIHAEMILNGLSGNGVNIETRLIQGSTSTSLGQFYVSGPNDRLETVALPAVTTLMPGDKIAVHVNDAGSYLYDHVNINVEISPVPAPAAGLALGMGLLGLARRRR